MVPKWNTFLLPAPPEIQAFTGRLQSTSPGFHHFRGRNIDILRFWCRNCRFSLILQVYPQSPTPRMLLWTLQYWNNGSPRIASRYTHIFDVGWLKMFPIVLLYILFFIFCYSFLSFFWLILGPLGRLRRQPAWSLLEISSRETASNNLD